MGWRHTQGVDYRALPIYEGKHLVYYPQYRINGGEWECYTNEHGDCVARTDLHRVAVFFGTKGIRRGQWEVSR